MSKTKPSSRSTARIVPVLAALLSCAPGVHAAGSLTNTGFTIDPALPVSGDPQLGYMDVDPSSKFQLPGGTPIDSNNFSYPAARLGKFSFDPNEVLTLFPVANSTNDLRAISISLTMSISDLDTNPPDDDFEDIIFALSLSDADDNSSFPRILSDMDGSTNITPQFITGLGNQAFDVPPDVATNTYDLSIAPVLGTNLATLFSGSTGGVWLYLIDTDDFGNNISLANSLTSDFALTVDFIDVATVPVPPAIVLLCGGLAALLRSPRRTGTG